MADLCGSVLSDDLLIVLGKGRVCPAINKDILPD